ncbi:MAG: DUF6034 family protein [Lachnospiraceae bacterium]
MLLNQGDESSVQEQVQAPVRYLCDKDFSNFRLLANARVIVPEVEGIQLKKIRSRNFSSEEMERMEKALMKGGAFYEIRQGVDYDTEIKETEIEGSTVIILPARQVFRRRKSGLPWGPARRLRRFRRFLLVRMWKLLQKGVPTRSSIPARQRW